jgi:hypothetical protein
MLQMSKPHMAGQACMVLGSALDLKRRDTSPMESILGFYCSIATNISGRHVTFLLPFHPSGVLSKSYCSLVCGLATFHLSRFLPHVF